MYYKSYTMQLVCIIYRVELELRIQVLYNLSKGGVLSEILIEVPCCVVDV